MPYKAKSDLPDSVQHVLPAHAQDIYKEAFNSAWEQYKDKDDRRRLPAPASAAAQRRR
jgi:cation transport regulator